jgi:lysophospholipase L1-like esterase
MIDNPYSYRYHGRNKLLITVGDSWTYGDSLGKTKVRNGVDDTEYRLNNVFGSLLAEDLEANWINLALPGGSNAWMLDNLELLLSTLKEEDVTCIITLTESGRHEELKLIDRSLHTQQKVLEAILQHTYNRIENIKQRYPEYKFITAHNFTDPLTPDSCAVPMTWLEVMLNEYISERTHIVVSDYIKHMNYESRFPDVLEIIDKANKRVKLMDNCIYCNSEDTRHPTNAGHYVWAKYLKECIEEDGTINYSNA